MGIVATVTDADTPGYATSDWAGENARRWAAQADRLEQQLVPVSNVLFGAAKLQRGERVLDVGCGRAATTREAAVAVGPTGWATGIDVGAPLLDEAKVLAASDANVDFLLADAQRHVFESPQFDVVISRFGVMFFDDAALAFANIRTAVRTGGRLAMAVWQTRGKSELLNAPLQLGASVMRAYGYEPNLPPPDGGPFSLSDAEHVNGLLHQAGWSDVRVANHELDLYNGGKSSVDEALEVALTIGPLRALLEEVPPDAKATVKDAVVAALREDFTRRHDGIGVKFKGGISIVTATNPTP